MEVESTIATRHSMHGDYSTTADIAQGIKACLRDSPKWLHMHKNNRESLDLIATKMARIVSGDEFEPDHWHDIQGYAKLAAVQSK